MGIHGRDGHVYLELTVLSPLTLDDGQS